MYVFIFRNFAIYCVRLSNDAPFCENYPKLYFDTKYLERGLNGGGGEIFGALFSKKCHFFLKKCPF